MPIMADSVAAVDVRRRAGWLPGDQDELEAWLAGHRERVEAKGDQVVPHPVIEEFQELIDRDPVVRMYLNQMIAQVPQGKPYRKRHLESVPQMLRPLMLGLESDGGLVAGMPYFVRRMGPFRIAGSPLPSIQTPQMGPVFLTGIDLTGQREHGRGLDSDPRQRRAAAFQPGRWIDPGD